MLINIYKALHQDWSNHPLLFFSSHLSWKNYNEWLSACNVSIIMIHRLMTWMREKLQVAIRGCLQKETTMHRSYLKWMEAVLTWISQQAKPGVEEASPNSRTQKAIAPEGVHEMLTAMLACRVRCWNWYYMWISYVSSVNIVAFHKTRFVGSKFMKMTCL